jgi:hypothetical protein
MTICPSCKGRATKLYNLSTGKFTYQQCRYEFVPVYVSEQGKPSAEPQA